MSKLDTERNWRNSRLKGSGRRTYFDRTEVHQPWACQWLGDSPAFSAPGHRLPSRTEGSPRCPGRQKLLPGRPEPACRSDALPLAMRTGGRERRSRPQRGARKLFDFSVDTDPAKWARCSPIIAHMQLHLWSWSARNRPSRLARLVLPVGLELPPLRGGWQFLVQNSPCIPSDQVKASFRLDDQTEGQALARDRNEGLPKGDEPPLGNRP